ncbi:piggyBac transposable element-derived protein 3-like [Zophobas morio]|uniref:piggyBac transposable element-derived protein 3-like n=1 Tax=Zophobas morio TaxID=2755281 RepID=UPI003082CB1B
MAYIPSDSEDDNLGDSDDEFVVQNSRDSSSSDSDDSISSSESDEDNQPVDHVATATNVRGKPTYKWTKLNNNDEELPLPPFVAEETEESEIGRPIHYYQQFFSNELLYLIVEQSNLYAIQNDVNKPLNLTRSELEIFIGTVIYMSIFHLPRHRLYWKSACRVAQVADCMSRKRWEDIKKNLHFNNNDDLPTDRNDPNRDKLFKLRPIIDALTEKFKNQVKPQMLCVDEQIVPYKGRSALKQYNPKKPNKWGYKIFVLCDSSGLVHNFEIYTGKILPTPGKEDIGASGNIVLRLASVIPQHKNYLLFFDNWFTSVKLLTSLQEDGIYSLGTVRCNRLPGLQFSSDNVLKKKGRGTYEEYKTTVNSVDIHTLKWFDNKSVCLLSTFCGSQPVDIVERFDRKGKRRVEVTRPNMIKLYNNFMGGVDLLDGLISYYRISLGSRKWYLKLFFHLIDLALVSAWLKYKTDMQKSNMDKKDILDSLGFRAEVAEALCRVGKDENTRKRGRPSGSTEKNYEEKKRRGATKPIPQFDVRTDKVAHFPSYNKERQRCKRPLCGLKTYFYCVKCKVHLCITKTRNCFAEFHI